LQFPAKGAFRRGEGECSGRRMVEVERVILIGDPVLNLLDAEKMAWVIKKNKKSAIEHMEKLLGSRQDGGKVQGRSPSQLGRIIFFRTW